MLQLFIMNLPTACRREVHLNRSEALHGLPWGGSFEPERNTPPLAGRFVCNAAGFCSMVMPERRLYIYSCLCILTIAFFGCMLYNTAIGLKKRIWRNLFMKRLRKTAAALLAAGMILSMSACSQSGTSSTASTASAAGTSSAAAQTSVDKVKAAGTVVMATNAEFEPFEYKDGSEYAGIDVEISQKIAEKLGVKLEIHDVAFTSTITEIQTGKANFAATGMTVTEDRKQNVDFSDTYFKATQSIIVVKGSSITKPADLAGKIVGVQEGTTGDTYCTDDEKKNNVNVKSVQRYNKGVDAVSDLMAGRVDAVVIDDFPAQKFISKNPDKIQKLTDALTVEEYAIAVPKGDAAMLKTVNEVLAGMKSSGDLDKLVEKYKSVLEGE